MAKVHSVKVEYGVSAEIKGNWHKLYIGVEVLVDEGDDFGQVKKRAWNTCYSEIEKQIQELSN